MKKIDIKQMLKDNNLDYKEEMEMLGMEFIKMYDGNYMIKNSNGRIVSEQEKIKLENRELIIKDVESNRCQKDTTKKLTENKKKLEKLNDSSIKKTSTTK